MISRSSRRRVVWIAVAVLVGLPLTGAIYQAVSVHRESARFPPPGRLIAVWGERKLHLVCLGDGEPTVIFESGGFTNSLSFEAARQEVSRHTRVCSYDRMGMGWSDPAPKSVSVSMLADDLDRLTEQAGLRPPFVLVPSSLGGLPVEMFARLHPGKTAGLVYLDAGNSAMVDTLAPRFSPTEVSAICLAEPAARFGILRLFDPFGLHNDASWAGKRSVSRLYRVEPMHTLCALVRGLATSREEFRTAPRLLPDLPLLVLIHDKPFGFLPAKLAKLDFLSKRIESFDQEWVALQHQFAGGSSRGAWRVVAGSGHLIAAEQPHTVAASVLEMVTQIRNSRHP